MRVVVTGGAGFIGANTCARLLETPGVERVVVVDDFSSGNADNLKGLDVELHEGTILDAELLERAFAGATAVVHLAAVPSVPRSIVDPVRTHGANATGTLQVLQAARRADNAHVLVASSSSVYGANPAIPKVESLRCMPMSPYAVSKLAAETYTLAFGRCYDLPVLPFRFFNVFGPLQPAGHAYAAVVPAFIDAALAGKPLTVYGDGEQTRDFTMVDTVTSVICDAIVRRVISDEPVNLALGTRTSLNELIAVLESALDRPVEVTNLEPRVGDVRDSQADPGRLKGLFPAIEPVTLVDGLARTVDWFRGA